MGRVRIEQFRMQFQDARSNTELSGIYSNQRAEPLPLADEYVDVRT